MPITHAKVSAQPDGGNAALVQPSDWNDDHIGEADALGVLAIGEGDNPGLRRIHAVDNGTSLGAYIDLDDAESATIGGTATVTGGYAPDGRGGAGVFEGGIGDEGGPVSVVAGASMGDNDGGNAVLEAGSVFVTGNFGGTAFLRGGGGQAAGTTGGEARVTGGSSQGSGTAAYILAEGMPSGATHGKLEAKTNGTQGSGGQALLSDGGGKLVFAGVKTGSGAPSGAPSGFLPLYLDTAASHALYVWDGAAWRGPY